VKTLGRSSDWALETDLANREGRHVIASIERVDRKVDEALKRLERLESAIEKLNESKA
jgi:hypothetical protein